MESSVGKTLSITSRAHTKGNRCILVGGTESKKQIGKGLIAQQGLAIASPSTRGSRHPKPAQSFASKSKTGENNSMMR